jgi:hypothetical protein
MPGGPGVGDIILQAAQGIVAMNQRQQSLSIQQRKLEQDAAIQADSARVREEGLALRERNAKLQEERFELEGQRFEQGKIDSAAKDAVSTQRFEQTHALNKQRVELEQLRFRQSALKVTGQVITPEELVKQQQEAKSLELTIRNKELTGIKSRDDIVATWDGHTQDAKFASVVSRISNPDIRFATQGVKSLSAWQGMKLKAQASVQGLITQGFLPGSEEVSSAQAQLDLMIRADKELETSGVYTPSTVDERVNTAQEQQAPPEVLRVLQGATPPQLTRFEAFGPQGSISDAEWSEELARARVTKDYTDIFTRSRAQVADASGRVTPEGRRILTDLLMSGDIEADKVAFAALQDYFPD